MTESLHHVHIFASDLETTVRWWREVLGGEVVYDGDFGGVRNVFMRVGRGGLHIYDQRPRGAPGGAVHHVGIASDDLPALVARIEARGVELRSGIRERDRWRYIMCTAPDDVLLELFSCDADLEPPEVARYLRGE